MLLAKSVEEPGRIVGSFDDVCRRRILKVNENKSKTSFSQGWEITDEEW